MQLPFTGREKESFTLNRIIKKAFDDKIQTTVYLDGEAGIGKSRFLEEFIKSNNYKAHYIYGDEKKSSWQPLISFLKTYFLNSANPNKTKSDFLTAFNELSQDLADSALKKQLVQYKSIFSGFVGIKSTNSFFTKLEPRAQYENLLKALYALLSAEFVKQPFVLIIEDAHWLDLETVKFLTSLKNSTIPLIISSRHLENNAENNISGLYGKRVKLLPLSQKSCKEILKRSLKKDSFKDQSDSYLKKSSGNPLVLKSFIEANFQANENLDLAAAITKKLNSLTLERQNLIKTAAVLGNNPDKKILHEMFPDQKLEQTGFLTGKQSNLHFDHALIKDNIYNSQAKQQLLKMHLSLAKTIETKYKDCIDNHLESLAEHYEKAYQYSESKDELIRIKLLEYWQKAGDYARVKYGNKKALEYYEKYDDQTESGSKNYKLILSKCEMLNYLNQPDITNKICMNYLSDDKTIAKDLFLKGKFYDMQGWTFYLKYDLDNAENYLNNSIDIFNKLELKSELCSVYGKMAHVKLMKRNFDEAIEFYEKQNLLAKSINDFRGLITSLKGIAITLYYQDKNEKALEYLFKAEQYNKTYNKNTFTGSLYGDFGIVYWSMGKFDEALKSYNLANTAFVEMCDFNAQLINLSNMSALLTEKGEINKALKNNEYCMLKFNDNGNKTMASSSACLHGDLLLIKKQYSDSLKYYNIAIKTATDPYYISYILYQKSFLYYTIKDYSSAKTFLIKSKRIATKNSIDDVAYKCQILKYLIDFYSSNSSKIKTVVIDTLIEVVNEDTRLEQKDKAELNFEIWKMLKQVLKKSDNPNCEELDYYYNQSLSLFQELYNIRPTYSFKVAIKSLTSSKIKRKEV